MSKGTPRDPMKVVQVILRKSDVDALVYELRLAKHFLPSSPKPQRIAYRVWQQIVDRWNVSPKYSGRDQQYSFSTKGRTP